MASLYGAGGRNSSYGWSNREPPPDDPAVTEWLAALWAKPFTYAEYDEMRALAVGRNADKPKGGGK